MSTVLFERRKKLKESLRKEALGKLEKTVEFLYKEGASEVYLFGSILKPFCFDEYSDIDIAVKELHYEKRIYVESKLEDYLGEFEYDIIFLEENLREEIKDRIEKEGVLWKP